MNGIFQILNWIIFKPDSTFDWIVKIYRTPLGGSDDGGGGGGGDEDGDANYDDYLSHTSIYI